MDWLQILSNTASSILSPATIGYALAALGLAVHFGYTGLINMGIAGLGSGALVAALPAAAAAAAPPERTGIATGMTNGTKTVGGAIASAIFAIALTATGSLDATSEHVAPFSGYLTVWAVCAGASFLAALALLAAPRHAFSDVRNETVPH